MAAASASATGSSSGAGIYGPAGGAGSAGQHRARGGVGSARKKRRWDDTTPVVGAIGDADEMPAVGSGKAGVSDWDGDVATPVRRSFGGSETARRTPGGGETPGRSRWDQTPSRDAQVIEYLQYSPVWFY